jgi:23S rRNA U2552 (ribose-2'-O)-methylase RlmE/FtsJ
MADTKLTRVVSTTSTIFHLPPIDKIETKNVQLYVFDELDETHAKLDAAKRLYDEPYLTDRRRFQTITRQFEHATGFKHYIHNTFNASNVTNAWLKAYEMFVEYKVFPEDSGGSSSSDISFTHFDNAAFPGSFILAGHHFAHTRASVSEYKWHGSSLLDITDNTISPLEDKYNLYKNYKQNWAMSDTNNGDVLSVANQKDWHSRFGGTVDLYTSDLGFDVSADYSKQEQVHAMANLGQILAGLMVLKAGGNMITKQYTYYESFTISLMGLMTTLFDKVDICKPMFSKSGNSETYLVCIGLKQQLSSGDISNIDDAADDAADETPTLENQTNVAARIMMACLERAPLADGGADLTPLLTKGCLGVEYLTAVVLSQTYISGIQIKRLEDTVAEYNRFVKLNRTNTKYVQKNNRFKKKNITDLRKWGIVNKIEWLPDANKLNIREVISSARR